MGDPAVVVPKLFTDARVRVIVRLSERGFDVRGVKYAKNSGRVLVVLLANDQRERLGPLACRVLGGLPDVAAVWPVLRGNGFAVLGVRLMRIDSANGSAR